MYKIYHRQPLYPGLVFSDQKPLPADTLDWPADYPEVAHVEAENVITLLPKDDSSLWMYLWR